MSALVKNYILDEVVAEKKLRRMAFEILENNASETDLILAGIRDNGSVVAKSIQNMLAELSTLQTRLLDISLDKKNPGEIVVSEKTDFNGKVIIIIDDVASSGKTLLYSLRPFLNYHPKKIQILVLIDRTHKAYPIKADYVGISVATTLQEHIYVEVGNGRVTGAYLQ